MDKNFIDQLVDIVGHDRVLTDELLTERSHHIWQLGNPLKVQAMVLPKSALELSKILKLCNINNQTIVIHGGLTNLVGSTEYEKDDLIISLEKMNQIEEIDPSARTATVQAGVILQNLHEAVKDFDLLFPLNFGAKGSAQIGGIISTNAGGLRVLKYGMTRNLVLGLEVVLADGTIISSMKKIVKDNSGYDLKQFFIGAEGTLGIVTRAVLKLVEQPKSRNSALVAIDEYEKVISLLKYMDLGLAGALTGFELMFDAYYKSGTSEPAVPKPPLPHGYRYYVLIESMGGDLEGDHKKLESLIQDAFEEGLIKDAVFANSKSDLDWFWKIREDVHACASRSKFDQHFDISIPIPLIGKLVKEIEDELWKVKGVTHVFAFGHVADGNIHFIIGKDNSGSSLKEEINEIIYSPLKAIGGSVSAEHGIGFHKKAYLHLCRTEEEIFLMKKLKRTFDPKNLLNRGKIFDL